VSNHTSESIGSGSFERSYADRSIGLSPSEFSLISPSKKIPGHVRIGRGTPDWSNFANCWAVSGGYRLVTLSVVIAVLVSYAALDLAGRVTSARGVIRILWLSGGAVAMGIWHMLHALHRDAGLPIGDSGPIRLPTVLVHFWLPFSHRQSPYLSSAERRWDSV
jgi:hypothetical protein